MTRQKRERPLTGRFDKIVLHNRKVQGPDRTCTRFTKLRLEPIAFAGRSIPEPGDFAFAKWRLDIALYLRFHCRYSLAASGVGG